MSKRVRECWHCDHSDCGHDWLIADPSTPPTWCSKCKRRGWNKVQEKAAHEQDARHADWSKDRAERITNKESTVGHAAGCQCFRCRKVGE